MDTNTIGRDLFTALWESAEAHSFVPLVEGLVAALDAAGLRVGRLQLPLAQARGFRHPTLATLLLTWTDTDKTAVAEAITHAMVTDQPQARVFKSPYRLPLETGRPYVVELSTDADFAILRQLYENGYRHYVAMPIPAGAPGQFQPLSIASRHQFPDDLLARLDALTPLFSLAVYGAYRSSQAITLANAYIGPASGPRVLAGEIRRGSTRKLRAGIVFCDIRGFTALSEELGAEGVVKVVNQVFEEVGDEARLHGGEILKFIGDAMLLVFPVNQEDEAKVAKDMVAMATHALQRVRAADLGVQVGFGGHIGEVVQGNIGTPDRVDFTVLGPAVNLASRLESLCKPLAADGVFSATVAQHTHTLQPQGTHTVKGIATPVPVWVLHSAPTGPKPT